MTRLHYALDVTSREEVLALGALAAERGVEVVEAGSLLVKITGLSILSTLREVLPDAVLVADLKTLDMGEAEVTAAAAAGADEVIIAAAASDYTVEAAVSEARRAGVRVLATMIGVDDFVRRAHEMVALGVDIVLGHNAIDDPNTWLDPQRYEPLSRMAQELGPAFAISGSLDLDTAAHVLGLAPERIVVGRAITTSADPGEALDAWLELVRSAPRDGRAAS